MALIGRVQWKAAAEHKAKLLAVVERRRQLTPGTGLAIAPGAWSSDKTLFEDGATWPLVLFIQKALEQLALHERGETVRDISGWANVLAAGQFIGAHAHEASHLGGDNAYAGVYYLQIGGAGGELHLFEPDQPVVVVTPEEGLLVLFEAGTQHEVVPLVSDTPRVSIAFNVRVDRD